MYTYISTIISTIISARLGKELLIVNLELHRENLSLNPLQLFWNFKVQDCVFKQFPQNPPTRKMHTVVQEIWQLQVLNVINM